MDDTPTRLCKCGRPYRPRYPEQLRCLRCRTLALSQDAQRRDSGEVEFFNKLRAVWARDTYDWQLKDPDHPGQLIWASDLAKLYRAQTRPRPVRNNLSRWL